MATVYQVMAGTGLRWNECRTLAIGDVHLKEGTGFITLKAENEKNRQGSELPLSEETRAVMDEYMVERLNRLTGGNIAFPGAFNHKLFFDGLPLSLAKPFKKDCEIAKVKIEDASGRVIDLHSLRYFFGTELARAGVPITTTQKLMRHSTPHITAKVYVHATLKDKAEAVNLLPGVSAEKKVYGKVSVEGAPEGQFSSIHVHSSENKTLPRTQKNPATTGRITNDSRAFEENKMVNGAGLEPAATGLKVRCSTD